MQAVVAAGTGATPAAFYLGLCRLRGILSPSAYHNCAAGGPFFDAAVMTMQAELFSFAATKIRFGGGPLSRQGQVLLRRLFLRIMPPSWHPVPVCVPRLRCRRAVLHRNDGCAASIRKSGPEIKNRCTQEGINGEKHASIRKFGLEIKNRCSSLAVLEGFLAAIPKFDP